MGDRGSQIDLKMMISDSLDAVAMADADRLERSIHICKDWLRQIEAGSLSGIDRADIRVNIRGLAVFARVLEAARANLDLLGKFHSVNSGEIEYVPHRAVRGCGAKGGNGND